MFVARDTKRQCFGTLPVAGQFVMLVVVLHLTGTDARGLLHIPVEL